MIEGNPADLLLDRIRCSSRHERRVMLETVKLVQERGHQITDTASADGAAVAFHELQAFLVELRAGLELRL